MALESFNLPLKRGKKNSVLAIRLLKSDLLIWDAARYSEMQSSHSAAQDGYICSAYKKAQNGAATFWYLDNVKGFTFEIW